MMQYIKREPSSTTNVGFIIKAKSATMLLMFLAFGSSLAHGDQASQLRSVFTSGNIVSAGAELPAERDTTN